MEYPDQTSGGGGEFAGDEDAAVGDLYNALIEWLDDLESDYERDEVVSLFVDRKTGILFDFTTALEKVQGFLEASGGSLEELMEDLLFGSDELPDLGELDDLSDE